MTKHDDRAGDFEVEVVGSLVVMAVLDGLKVELRYMAAIVAL